MWIQLLDDFIKNSQDKLEITRANAVKMVLCGYKHQEIMQVLAEGVTSGINRWQGKPFRERTLKR